MRNKYKSIKIVGVLTALGLTAALVTACSSSPSGSGDLGDDCVPATADLSTITAGVLTVGVPENRPITTTDGNDADGFEIDVVKEIALAECLTTKFVPITYGNGIPMVAEQKNVDMITGGWYVTEDRAKIVSFTAPTFYDAMAVVSKEGYTTVDEFTELDQVGSGTGYSWEADTQKLMGDRLKSYPGPVEMKQDMDAGRVNAVLEGYAPAKFIYEGTDYKVEAVEADERITVTVNRPFMAFPLAKDNTALADALSTQIDALRESGELANILEKWDMPTDFVVPAEVAADAIR